MLGLLWHTHTHTHTHIHTHTYTVREAQSLSAPQITIHFFTLAGGCCRVLQGPRSGGRGRAAGGSSPLCRRWRGLREHRRAHLRGVRAALGGEAGVHRALDGGVEQPRVGPEVERRGHRLTARLHSVPRRRRPRRVTAGLRSCRQATADHGPPQPAKTIVTVGANVPSSRRVTAGHTEGISAPASKRPMTLGALLARALLALLAGKRRTANGTSPST